MEQRRIRRLHRALLRRGLEVEFNPRQETAPRARLREIRVPNLSARRPEEASEPAPLHRVDSKRHHTERGSPPTPVKGDEG